MTAAAVLAITVEAPQVAAAAMSILLLALAAWVLSDRARSSWRLEVERRLARLAPDPGTTSVVDGFLGRVGPGGWWTGRNEDLAHAAIDRHERAQELGVIKAASGSGDDEREALAASLRVQLRRVYRSNDAAAVEATALLAGESGPPPTPPSSSALGRSIDIVHEGWSRLRRAQRARRNRAILLSTGFVIAGVGVAWMIDGSVGSVSLASILTPGTPAPNPPDPVANPYGLLALGAVGGLVSLLPLVRRTPDITRSSGGWTAQAFLKVTSGALLALLGCWVLQSDVVDLTARVTANQLAVWAVLFGYSQDAVTKRFDERLAPTPTETTTPATGDDDGG